MQIKELIKELSKFDPNIDISTGVRDGNCLSVSDFEIEMIIDLYENEHVVLVKNEY